MAANDNPIRFVRNGEVATVDTPDPTAGLLQFLCERLGGTGAGKLSAAVAISVTAQLLRLRARRAAP